MFTVYTIYLLTFYFSLLFNSAHKPSEISTQTKQVSIQDKYHSFLDDFTSNAHISTENFFDVLKDNIAWAKKNEDNEKLISTYLDLAKFHHVFGNYHTALSSLDKALNIAQDTNDSTALIVIFGNMAKLNLDEGYEEIGIQQRNFAFHLAQKTEQQPELYANIYSNYAAFHFDKGKYPLALSYSDSALQFINEKELPKVAFEVYLTRAKVLAKMGMWRSVKKSLAKAHQITGYLNEIEQKKGEAILFGEMAKFYRGQGNISKSKVYLFLSLGITHALNDVSQSKEIYKQLSLDAQLSNNFILANQYQSKEKALENEIIDSREKANQIYWKINGHDAELRRSKLHQSSVPLHFDFFDIEFTSMFLFWGFGGVLFASYLLFRENRKRQLMNDTLLQKNKEISEQSEEIKAQKADIEKQNTLLQFKNKELASFDQEKNQLIGIVAHDLKSPLKQINGLMSIILMEKGNLSESQLECMNRIMDSSKKASEMINKILDLDAIEANQANINFEKVDLANIVESIADNYKANAQEKAISIKFQPESSAYFANVDKEYVIQIIENLLSNAIKFSPYQRSIYLSLSKSEGLVQFRIKDEGPGISKEDQTRLFGKFQKLSARPTAGESSTGLGLSIVKKYVEMMNGKVWCESQEGEGACFFIEFPAVS